MNLIEFYKKVLKSLGLSVTEDGYIKIGEGKDAVMLTVDGKPMVLPTKEHINSIIGKDEDGNPVVTKLPYNPLNENVIKGDTASLKKTKTIIERKLGHSIAAVGEMLLMLAANEDFQKKTNLELNKFLGRLNEAQNTGIKKIVDDKSIESWTKIYANTLKSTKGMVVIYLKKSGVYKGVKYNRLATTAFPVYEALLEADKDTPVFDVKLRNKDIKVFRIIFEFILNHMDENHKYVIGSNDGDSPAFIALFKTYLKIGNRLNKLAKMLKFVSEEAYDQAKLPICITEKEVENVGIFKSELIMIPNETDFQRQKIETKIKESGVKQLDMSQTINNDKSGIPPWESPSVSTQTQQSTQQTQEEEDPVRKALYGNGFIKPVQVNPVVTGAVGNVGMMTPTLTPQLSGPALDAVPTTNTMGQNITQPNMMGGQQMMSPNMTGGMIPNTGMTQPMYNAGYQQPNMMGAGVINTVPTVKSRFG